MQTSSGVEITGLGASSTYLSHSRNGSSLYSSQSTSPYLFGQAWHLIAPDQLFSNRITEILSVSLYLTPRGYTVDVLYRHWTLPQTVTPPLPRTNISSVSPPQLYHGPIDHASWFSAIFEPSPQRVSRVTLILSSGTPYRTGLPPPLATLDSLPEVVEVHRVVPFL